MKFIVYIVYIQILSEKPCQQQNGMLLLYQKGWTYRMCYNPVIVHFETETCGDAMTEKGLAI